MLTAFWPRVAGLAIILAVAGCTGSKWGGFDDPVNRNMSIRGYAVTGYYSRLGLLTGRAPQTIAVTAGASWGWQDENANRIGPEAITNLEIDFGDGSGWISFADEWREWDHDPPGGMYTDNMAQHTYAKPGRYYVTARATYWDGSVLYSDPNHRIGVSVFPLGLPLPTW